MRDVPALWEAWKSGVYVGDTRPCTRVTVEKSFFLRSTDPVLGQWKRGPARWYQRANPFPDVIDPGDTTDAQIETELPNVLTVSHESSIDSDAGTCNIVMLNFEMPEYGEEAEADGQWGRPGAFTFDRGASQDAKARWGHARNEWWGVLVPNALIRVYQGYGGHDKSLRQAIDDGNIVLNGVYLLDEVNTSTDGTLHLKGRNMAKLVVDQQLFPPLVPKAQYPIKYCRYSYQNFKIPPDPKPSATHQIITQPTEYGTCGTGPFSSTDQTYGEFDTAATGHRPSECLDWSHNDPPHAGPGQIAHQRSYWLSEPKASKSDSVWITFCCKASEVNLVYFHPWGGNYRVMVSVYENGEWVPPEAGGQGGITPQGIPYVSAFTSNWEGGLPPGADPCTYVLPRTYRASQIRLTITNLTTSQEGGYRAGARKVVALFDQTLAEYPPLSFACAAYPSNVENKTGYWQVRSNGRLYAFGDARIQGKTRSDSYDMRYPIIAMNAHPSGEGYWVMDYSGHIESYGAAVHYGDPDSDGQDVLDVVDFAPTPSGEGYWVLHKDGTVDSYGDATPYGNATVAGTMPSGAAVIARSIESHPSTQGYWILLTDGDVQEFNLTNHGSANRFGFADTEYVASIRRTSTGDGYWIPSGGGIVQAFGDAPALGNVQRYPAEKWVYGLCWDMMPYSVTDNGYAVQYADGNLAFLGDFEYFGSVGAGEGQLRLDGNYKDYSDIIKELLLWSGFYLRKDPQPTTEKPAVYGNIESTGAFSKECLPADMFDKKPVADAVRAIKEIVGYIFYVDQEGGARFESPNWWTQGNFTIDGTPFDFLPEIDEQVQLIDYSMSFGDSNTRSEIIVASADPTETQASTVVTRVVPPNQGDLKGLVRPAMWTNGAFASLKEQQVMADLIAMHTWFARRQSTVTCAANPLIGINDQVKIYERQSSEVYIHYVRGVSFNHDLTSGDFTMTLTTHWLGGSPYNQTPLFFACAGLPDGGGYWQVDSAGSIFAYGDAELYPKNMDDSHTEWVVGMRSTLTGLGYYTIDISGKILTYGDAVNYGSVRRLDKDVKDFALTPSGEGYWVLLNDGTVYNFGDAIHYGDATVAGTMPSGSPIIAHSIESHPSTQGYWILLTDGSVQAFNLTNHGSADRDGFALTEYVGSLRRTRSGGGYWIPSGSALVQAFGDAVFEGDGQEYPPEKWVYGLVWDFIPDYTPGNSGYALQHADGTLDFQGDFVDQGDSSGALGGSGAANKSWAVANGNAVDRLADRDRVIGVSDDVMKFLAKTSSPSANNAVAANFGEMSPPTTKARTT